MILERRLCVFINFKSGIKLMEQNGAKITATEAAIFELLKTSKHPDFKEIQALVK